MSRRFVLAGSAAFALLGAGLVWAGFHLHAGADLLLREGLEADATVVALRTEKRYTDDANITVQGQSSRHAPPDRRLATYEVDIPTLRFAPPGGAPVEVDGTVQKPGSLAVGTTVAVRYLPGDPRGARMVTELENPAGPYALWGLGIALLLPALFMMLQVVRRRI